MRSTASSVLLLAAALGLVLGLGGCPAGHDHSGHDHDHDHDHGAEGGHAGHSHAAKHGGFLVPLEGGAANLELLWDAEKGVVTGWVLDGCCENPVRIEQESIVLKLSGAGGFDLPLLAVGNELTGEKPKDTSQFAAKDPRLLGLKVLEGTVDVIVVKGVPTAGAKFSSAPASR